MSVKHYKAIVSIETIDFMKLMQKETNVYSSDPTGTIMYLEQLYMLDSILTSRGKYAFTSANDSRISQLKSTYATMVASAQVLDHMWADEDVRSTWKSSNTASLASTYISAESLHGLRNAIFALEETLKQVVSMNKDNVGHKLQHVEAPNTSELKCFK
jgi:hypothetical protein